MYVWTVICMYVCMYLFMFLLSVCLSVCVCLYVCMHSCIFAFLYVCMYVCMYEGVHILRLTYIHTSPYGWSRGQLPPQQCSGQREVAGVGPPRVRRHHQSSHSGPRTASLSCIYVCMYVCMYVCNLCMDPM